MVSALGDKRRKVILQPSLEGAKTCPLGAKIGLVLHAQADPAVLRRRSGHVQERSPSAQVKVAGAHAQRLKRNQRKQKSSMAMLVARLPSNSEKTMQVWESAVSV
jgi:hypothetical protein